MIAAATQATHSFALDNLPFGWFDVALVAVLAFGLFRGRKNGMTKECLPVLHWLALVVACGLGYQMVGQIFVNLAGWGNTLCYILGYLCVALVVTLLFVVLKKTFLPRLTGSNFFGRGEYYLGMLSGMVRFACILFFALALLNAPYYSAEDIAKNNAYVSRWFGGGLYNGDFFPTLQSVQEDVFKKSLIGPFITNSLGVLLINSVPSDKDKSAAVPQKHPIIHIGN
jgi:uncharacterized membrane protein required for colicin V production